MALKPATQAFVAAGVVGGMLALTFASKPLYDTFCRVTGFGGTTRVATEAPDRVLERMVNVRFDANVANAPIQFRPSQVNFDVALGVHSLASYEVVNNSDSDISVIASYNVTPHTAGRYFNKLECFCFEERVLKAGERKTLPVVFFVSPDLDDDPLMKTLSTITLSYTFYQTDDFEGATKSAALANTVAQP